MKNVFKKVKGLIPNLRERLVLFKDSNDGASIVEVVLILVILIGIVLIFKTEITGIINDAFTSIANDSQGIIH